MKITCCLHCVEPKRHLGCHGSCKEYIDACKANKTERERIQQQKRLEYLMASIMFDGMKNTKEHCSTRTRMKHMSD